jgi:hypothetical protein
LTNFVGQVIKRNTPFLPVFVLICHDSPSHLTAYETSPRRSRNPPFFQSKPESTCPCQSPSRAISPFRRKGRVHVEASCATVHE